MTAKKCNLCGGRVDFSNGGCAIMFTLCMKNTVNMINLSFCKDCYEYAIDGPLRKMNEDGELRIDFGDEK